MGDFNIKWDVPSFLHSTLEHSLEAFDITRIPFGATHHRGNSHTTIDYICVSDISRVLSYNQVHWSSISLQDALFATFNFEVQPVDPRVITLRSFKNMNTAHFLRDLEDINWTEIVHIPDIDANNGLTKKSRHLLKSEIRLCASISELCEPTTTRHIST